MKEKKDEKLDCNFDKYLAPVWVFLREENTIDCFCEQEPLIRYCRIIISNSFMNRSPLAESSYRPTKLILNSIKLVHTRVGYSVLNKAANVTVYYFVVEPLGRIPIFFTIIPQTRRMLQ